MNKTLKMNRFNRFKKEQIDPENRLIQIFKKEQIKQILKLGRFKQIFYIAHCSSSRHANALFAKGALSTVSSALAVH